MDLKKGQFVEVVDHFGSKRRNVVWEVSGDRVFVTSEKGYSALMSGDPSVWAIGFPCSAIAKIEPGFKNDLAVA